MGDSEPHAGTVETLCVMALETAASGMVLVDVRQPDEPVVLVNAAFERMTGYRRDEVIGRNLRFLQGEDRDQPGRRAMRAAITAGEPCIVELRNYRKDGTLFWGQIQLTPLRDDAGVVTHYVGVQDDITTRKQNEEALARSEARYREVFHDNRAVKLIIDPSNGQIVEVNQAASDFYGYTAEQLQAMSIHDINILSHDEVQAEMQRAKAQQRNFFEFRHRLASGEVRDVDVFSSPVTTPGGTRLYSIVVDVTGKREAEQARNQALVDLGVLHRAALEMLTLPDEESIYTYLGQELSDLLPHATILINRTNPDGTMTMQGAYGVALPHLKRVEQLLGFTPIGHTFAKDPEIHALFEAGTLVHYAGGLPKLAEKVVPKVVTRQLVRLLDLGEIYLMGLRRDDMLYAGVQIYTQRKHPITNATLIEAFVQQVSLALQRIQAVESLRESERRYRALFEQSNDAVFLLDMQGIHREVNQRAAEMLGYHPDEIVGMSFRDVVVPDEHSASYNVLKRLLNGEHVPPYERQFRRKDGTTFKVEINVEMVWGLHGPLHIQSIVRDITERREAEQQAFNMALERERVRLLAEFIENASHEFRTPLASINASAYLLKRLDDPDRRAKKAEVIEAQVQRMTRLVDMLLTMAKLERVQTLSQRKVNVNEVISAAVDAVPVPAAGPTLQTKLSPAEPMVLGSGDYLTMAITHLLENALRFTPATGTITVSSGVRDTYAWIGVDDEGMGIAPEHLPHIFETFWRDDRAHTEPGFGVGLSIAQRIVRLHYGDISVESQPGHGSQFRIWLPLLPEKMPLGR